MNNEIVLKPVIRIERDSICDSIDLNLYAGINLPSNVSLVPISKVPDLVNESILPNYANCGQTFLQSPYGDKEYFAIDDYEIAIMNKKAHHIDILAGLLGAIHSEYEIHLAYCHKRAINFTTKINSKLYLDTQVTAEYKKEQEERIKRSISVRTNYNGIIPNAENYQKALEYVKKHNLFNDESANALLTFRNPIDSNANMVSGREVTVQLSSELNKTMDFASQLGAMDGIINIDANFIQNVSIKKEATLQYTFQFAMPN